MSGTKYSLGVDFGTESGRAALFDVNTGAEVATSIFNYPDGVIDRQLPDGVPLGHDWALQNPADYIETLTTTIPPVLKESGVSREDVIGIGIDFTACTMLPIDKDDTPLCMKDEYKSVPHAWVKLWKHHAGQAQADRFNALAAERGEEFLKRYGGKTSSEWMFAKILQTLEEAPEICEAADRFIEAGDWVILKMTGNERRNSCTAGYKALWENGTGYPSDDFLAALDPELPGLVKNKLSDDIRPLGEKAGGLTAEMAELTGLKEGTAVAVCNVDAHVSVPACTVTDVGKLVMVMGTSICHLVMGHEKKIVEGMCGVVQDGVLPGFFGFEAGQCSGGDIYAWFIQNCVTSDYQKEAEERGIDIHQLLEEKANNLKPGQSGLLALDWLNGNRSILVDANLTGMILGLTLATKPEDIYRALIESTAYGTRIIIDSFQEQGVDVDEIYACGGLAEKNAMLMQIFSDVTGREIKLAASAQAPALGSAIFGAYAAGKEGGGYDSLEEAANSMASLKEEHYSPIPENQAVYEKLYAEYRKLHDYFGRGANDVMKTLKSLKSS
ncbi:ribulokinase [Candidatus Hydrogenedentota bacterium]